MRALSIRQQYAEQISQGTKRIEYRSRPTSILGERFYIYASLTPGPKKEFQPMGLLPGDLLTGVIVGTVEIENCTGRPGDYKWHLKRPKPLKRNLYPTKHPQPVWFNPF